MKNRIFLGFFLAVWVSLSLLNPWAGRLEGAGVQAKSRASGERALEDEEALTTIHLPLVVDGLINLPNFVDTPFGVEVRPTSDLPGMQKVSGAGASFTRLNGIFWANVEPERPAQLERGRRARSPAEIRRSERPQGCSRRPAHTRLGAKGSRGVLRLDQRR